MTTQNEKDKIAEMEDALTKGKHVNLSPDGTVTVSDTKPHPTIDQVLAEIDSEPMTTPPQHPSEASKADSALIERLAFNKIRELSMSDPKTLEEATDSLRAIWKCVHELRLKSSDNFILTLLAAERERCADAAAQDAQGALSSIGNMETIYLQDGEWSEEDYRRAEKCLLNMPKRIRALPPDPDVLGRVKADAVKPLFLLLAKAVDDAIHYSVHGSIYIFMCVPCNESVLANEGKDAIEHKEYCWVPKARALLQPKEGE